MSTGELIDSHVSVNQCKKAIVALTNHALKFAKQKEETQLLPKEENVWLIVTVKKMHPEKKLKPFKIPIKHPLVDPRTSPICLITKDPQREYKDLLESHNIRFISRVVGITKLKGKFKPFEARRALLKENGMFLADERVIPLLPGLLGTKFFEAKKQPIAVCLTRKDLKGELERAISSTYMHQNQGTCISIKIGTVSQTPDKILDNLTTALPAIVKNIKDSWDNIQSFNIKTNSSVSLPVWSCNLGKGVGARWEVEAEAEAEAEAKSGVEWSGFGEEDGEKKQSEASPSPPVSEVSKGKKRGAEEESEVPPKKAKVVENLKETRQKKAQKSEETSSSKVKLPSTDDVVPDGPASLTTSLTTSQVTTVSIDGAVKKTKRSKRKESAALELSEPISSSALTDGKTSGKEKEPSNSLPVSNNGPVKKPKRSKRKESAVLEPPVPVSSNPLTDDKISEKDKDPAEALPVPKKRKRKAKDSSITSAEPTSQEVPTSSEKKDVPETETSGVSSELAEAFIDSVVISSKTPGPEDKRRNATGIDKKKEKVTKGKVGKRAKDVLVGKAAKARV